MNARNPLPAALRRNAFRTAEAADWGLSRSRLRAKDLDRPFHGLRSEGLDLDDVIDRCRAVEPLLGAQHAFSHSTALALWGTPLPAAWRTPPLTLHIATRGPGRMRRPGIIGHQIRADAPVHATPDGFTAVSPAVAWCQFAGEQGVTLLDLVIAGDHLVTGRRMRGGRRSPAAATPDEMRQAVTDHRGGRGAKNLAAAVRAIRPGAASAKETELRLLLVASGLPEPVIGHVIRTRLGPLEPDLAYPGRRVLLEYEGDGHRTDVRQWRGEFERVRAFQQAGWTVIRVNADDLSDASRRGALIAHLRTLLA